jgi:hypothetical protein
MADAVTCTNGSCPEYGVEKHTLGGEIDETAPTYCGTCGAQVAGPPPVDPAR